ncbi:Hypothetical protein A7982_09929 [Minicystis rosea]|nr:Hypothetical protein A7982_09929 [Minicystis rosea]
MSDAPESQSPNTEAAFKPKRGRTYAALGGIAVAVIAAGAVFAWRADVDAREREAIAWGNVTRCLIGGEPLAATDKPSLRARKIQLRAVAEPYENRPASEGEAWPSRCAAPALALHETLKDTGRIERDGAELGKGIEALGKKLKENNKPSIDIAETIDRLWDESKKIGLAPKVGGDVKAPPAAVETLTLDGLEAVPALSKKAFALDTVFAERVPAGVLRVIATSKDLPDAPLVCTFGEAAASGHCEKPPAPVLSASRDLRLLGSTEDEAKPLLFADKRGDGGIFRGDSGEKVGGLFSVGGFSRKDGFAATLGWDEKDQKKPFVLTRGRAGAPLKEDRFLPDGVRYVLNDVALLWDHIVWQRYDKDSGERHLMAHKLGDSEDPMKDATDIGKLWDFARVSNYERAEDTIRGCKTKEALAVLVHGNARDSVSFQVGDRWVSPLQLDGTGGELTCRGTEATETRVDPLRGGDALWKEQIRQDRCTPAGCLPRKVGVSDLLHGLKELAPGNQQALAATDLDGKLLVVWMAGAAGGVRMKLAPIDQIAAAPDTVILDDMTRGGQVQRARQLNDIKLFTRAGYAVLLVGSSVGVHALRIDADGKVSPIAMK